MRRSPRERRRRSRRRLLVLLTACGAGGSCGAIVAWACLPPQRTPAAYLGAALARSSSSLGRVSRRSPLFAVRRTRGSAPDGRGGRSRQWGHQGGRQHRKSFVGYFSVAALGFFGWAGKPEPAEAEEAPAKAGFDSPSYEELRQFLLNSGVASASRARASGSSSGEGGRRAAGHEVLTRTSEWFEGLFVSQAEKAARHGGGRREPEPRSRKELWRGDDAEPGFSSEPAVGSDSKADRGRRWGGRNADGAGPWSWLPWGISSHEFQGQEDSPQQEDSPRQEDGPRQEPPAEPPRPKAAVESSETADGKAEGEPEQEDQSGGPFAFLVAVKAAVLSAFTGGRSSEQAEEAEEGEEGEQKQGVEEESVPAADYPGAELAVGSRLEFPNPEDWLESARDAAMRLPLVASSEPEPEAAAPGAPAPAVVAEEPAGLAAAPVEPAPAPAEAEEGPAEPPLKPSEPEAGPREEDSEAVAPEPVAEVPQVDLDALPPPFVPGLAEADLIVRAEIEPKKVEAVKQKGEGVKRLMAKPGGAILATMCQSGWKVEPVDEAKGLFEISLPSVNYDLPGGRVSIPSPLFLATVRDSYRRDGDFEERLQGDLVLQNGEGIMTVELKFPFRKTFCISAAGWTRSRVAWERGGVVVTSNFVELGLQLPKVPGLAQIMQYFVKSYGTESTKSCAVALANGADEIDLTDEASTEASDADEAAVSSSDGADALVEEAAAAAEVADSDEAAPVEASAAEGATDSAEEPDWWESAQKAVSESARGFSDALGAAAAALPAPEVPSGAPVEERPAAEPEAEKAAKEAKAVASEPEWWESARDAVSESAESALSMLSASDKSAEGPPAAPAPAEAAAEGEESSSSSAGPKVAAATTPLPKAPGMDEANLVVHVEVDRKGAQAVETGKAGVARLMAQSGGAVLATMAQEGWEVRAVDEASGLYELSLPSVRYELPGGVVSIPAPRFMTTVYDTYQREGTYEERLFGDLVLVNGEDILTVELGFPFRTTFSVSAAGWTRALVGWEDDQIVIGATVEIGLQLPKFPGLDSIMKYFVKAYGTESTQQCASALARGADALPPDGAPPEWLISGLDAVAGAAGGAESFGSVLDAMPELPSRDDHRSEAEAHGKAEGKAKR